MCLAMTQGSVTVTVCWGRCPFYSWASLSHCSLTTSNKDREHDRSGNSTETFSPGSAVVLQVSAPNTPCSFVGVIKPKMFFFTLTIFFLYLRHPYLSLLFLFLAQFCGNVTLWSLEGSFHNTLYLCCAIHVISLHILCFSFQSSCQRVIISLFTLYLVFGGAQKHHQHSLWSSLLLGVHY